MSTSYAQADTRPRPNTRLAFFAWICLSALCIAALGDVVLAAASNAAAPPSNPIDLWTRLFYAFAGFGTILLLATAAANFKPLAFCIGVDGRTSNSKTQMALWSVTVLGVYLTTVLLRAGEHLGTDPAMPFGNVQVPRELLTLSGFSVASYAGAKAITVSKEASAIALDPRGGKQASNGASFYDLFRDDTGRLDLGDTQMILITFIAIGFYLANSLIFLGTLKQAPGIILPNVDQYLLATFGLGQGAYLAKKAASNIGAG